MGQGHQESCNRRTRPSSTYSVSTSGLESVALLMPSIDAPLSTAGGWEERSQGTMTCQPPTKRVGWSSMVFTHASWRAPLPVCHSSSMARP